MEEASPNRQLSSRQLSFHLHHHQPSRQNSFRQKKMISKHQLTSKRGDTQLHLAVRAGNLKEVLKIILVNGDCQNEEEQQKQKLLSMQNQSGETALYVSSEYGFVDITREIVKYYDFESASIKSRNGYDSLHIATKQGDLETLKIISESHPELLLTTDLTNTTALHTAASKGHLGIVNYLLDNQNCLASIARNNGKTPLHSAARNGHLEVVVALIQRNPTEFAMRVDKKGQTALHMAVKGHSNVEIVDMMVRLVPCLINLVDLKGNSALHIAARKGRLQIVQKLLEQDEVEKETINRCRETPLDTAEKTGHFHISNFLKQNNVRSAKSIINLPPPTPASTNKNHFNQTVSDIKHEVHDQIFHTRKTRRRMQHISNKLNKMQREGINNAINSSTIVAVLIASVAFAAIFSIPGQYEDNPDQTPPGLSLGEAKIAPRTEFIMFFLFDSVALFISLAVVVVQTSVVIIEKKAKKQMIAIINKLLWLACVLISMAFLCLSYIVVGKHDMWLAFGVAVMGAGIMVSTIGVMCFWVIKDRVEYSKMKSARKSSMSSTSRSRSRSKSRSMGLFMSDSDEMMEKEYKLFAV